MKIEILTQEMSKKSKILTFLANEPGVQASGQEVELSDLKLELNDNYLFFTIRAWERAEQIIPSLFFIRPNAYSPNYFEPYSDQRILITSKAKSILDIIPEISAVEHLNLEQGELAGNFEVRWQSRDVALLAKCYLMVEAGLASCKIKFETINRETEYQCKECIDKVNLHEILKVFVDELIETGYEPVISGPVIETRGFVDPQKWSEFITQSRAKIDFDSNKNEIKLIFSEDNYITFKEQGGQRNFILHFTNPELLNVEFTKNLNQNLGVTNFELNGRIENLAADLNELVDKIGFKKDQKFFNFTYKNDLTAEYNIKTRILILSSSILIDDKDFEKNLRNKYEKMQSFLSQVSSCGI